MTFVYTTKTRTERERERRINLVGKERIYLFCDGGEEHSFFSVFFVGGDREVGDICLNMASEIEWNGLRACTE